MKNVKITGRIIKIAGSRPETIVTAERYDSLGFSLLTRAQLDVRLAEAHSKGCEIPECSFRGGPVELDDHYADSMHGD